MKEHFQLERKALFAQGFRNLHIKILVLGQFWLYALIRELKDYLERLLR